MLVPVLVPVLTSYLMRLESVKVDKRPWRFKYVSFSPNIRFKELLPDAPEIKFIRLRFDSISRFQLNVDHGP